VSESLGYEMFLCLLS